MLLSELTKEEWRDVASLVRPDISDALFETMWEEFQKEKSKKRVQ